MLVFKINTVTKIIFFDGKQAGKLPCEHLSILPNMQNNRMKFS